MDSIRVKTVENYEKKSSSKVSAIHLWLTERLIDRSDHS